MRDVDRSKARTCNYLQDLDILQQLFTSSSINQQLLSLHNRHTFSSKQSSNMYNFSTLLTLASVAITALATSSEPQHYRLFTQVKPHQRAKISYNNLYLTTGNTGAGLSDATFVKNRSAAAVGYLNGTGTDNVQSFELPCSETPWYETTL